MKRLNLSILILVLGTACNPMRGFVESEFELTNDSRLPRWFSVPPGRSRDDVTVTLRYYTFHSVVLWLVDRESGRTLSKVSGSDCWHPEIDRHLRNAAGGFDPGNRPSLTVVRVGGAMEVFDHPPMTSRFRVVDDPLLVQEAAESLNRGECRMQ